MFEDTQVKEINRAILVGLNAPSLTREENATEETLEELAALLDTAGGTCLGTVLQNRPNPEPRTFIGEGKTAEIKDLVDTLGADIVIFDNPLSPSQQRVLTEELGVTVMDRAALIVAITQELLGQAGVVILAVVVTLACLTTAIGLFGATASYFERLTGGRLPYQTSVVLLAVIGCAICNLGLSTIISAASPVLSVICPPFMTTVVLLAFQNWISRAGLYKGAALGATLAALVLTFHDYLDLFPLVEHLPFYDYGFGWLVPAVAGGVIGMLLSKPAQPSEP